MDSKEELERLHLNMLAVYCQRVSESYPDEPEVARQARSLWEEWNTLIGFVKPPLPGVETRKDKESYSVDLKARMVQVLSGCSLPKGVAQASPASSKGLRSKKQTA